jgi:multidrug efflux system outer membrane protein
MRMLRSMGALGLGAVLAACSARAPYAPPVADPVASTGVTSEFFSPQAYDAQWWSQFDDPVLERLLEQALRSNQDLLAAVARVEQARAVFDDVKLDRYPTATVGGGVEWREQSVPGLIDEPIRTTTYRAALDMFWEIDLFGRVRAATRAASASAQEYEAALQDVRVVVAAEVARTYFELRGLQQQRQVVERSLGNQQETLRLTQVRRDAGLGEEFDVARAGARVAAIEGSLPLLAAGIARREHSLAVLAGVRPGALTEDLSPRPYAPLATALPIGDVAALLRRRPDVRQAERRLATVSELEGVAAADLFPRISIVGMLGLLAGRGSVFGTSDSRAWAVAPAMQWAGFDLGSARARLRGARAASREALASYDQTVLRALEETENAFVAYREDQQRLVKLADQVRESERASTIARARYREGISDFLALLDAERTQLDAEDAFAQAEARVFVSVVSVYKALGGP